MRHFNYSLDHLADLLGMKQAICITFISRKQDYLHRIQHFVGHRLGPQDTCVSKIAKGGEKQGIKHQININQRHVIKKPEETGVEGASSHASTIIWR